MARKSNFLACGRKTKPSRAAIKAHRGSGHPINSEEAQSAMRARTAIYEPPGDGLPYLVVTFAPGGGFDVVAANSRAEARIKANERVIQRRKESGKTDT